MLNSFRSVAALALLSGMGAGYSSGRHHGAEKREPTPEELERRREATERAERRRAESEVARQKWAETYNPTYATEPKREDFPSRQTFRKAHQKWEASHANA